MSDEVTRLFNLLTYLLTAQTNPANEASTRQLSQPQLTRGTTLLQNSCYSLYEICITSNLLGWLLAYFILGKYPWRILNTKDSQLNGRSQKEKKATQSEEHTEKQKSAFRRPCTYMSNNRTLRPAHELQLEWFCKGPRQGGQDKHGENEEVHVVTNELRELELSWDDVHAAAEGRQRWRHGRGINQRS